jgi:hypothetical protein
MSCAFHSIVTCKGFAWLITMGSGLDLLALLLQLQSIITAHNQWLCKTRSIPYRTTSVFSSTVTDLVLIYESVTSSASGVRWLTLHSWTPNSLTNAEWSLANQFYCSHWFLARGFFCPEDGDDTFHRNIGSHKIYTALHPRRRHSS